jgi:hypothetical protein
VMALYLAHFSAPLDGGQRPQHYLGYTPRDPRERFQDHLIGRNRPARIIRAALAAGLDVSLVRIWPDGTPQDEKRLKLAKRGFKHLCPKCKGGDNARTQ